MIALPPSTAMLFAAIMLILSMIGREVFRFTPIGYATLFSLIFH